MCLDIRLVFILKVTRFKNLASGSSPLEKSHVCLGFHGYFSLCGQESVPNGVLCNVILWQFYRAGSMKGA